MSALNVAARESAVAAVSDAGRYLDGNHRYRGEDDETAAPTTGDARSCATC